MGFRVYGLGFGVWGLGFGVSAVYRVQGLRCRVLDLGFRVRVTKSDGRLSKRSEFIEPSPMSHLR